MPTPINVTIASSSPIAFLTEMAWEFLTSRGYASKAAKRIIQRRVRQAGYRFYFFLPDEGPAQWGMFAPHEVMPPSFTKEGIIYTGVTLDHCAHQMGEGNANHGWRKFWNWN